MPQVLAADKIALPNSIPVSSSGHKDRQKTSSLFGANKLIISAIFSTDRPFSVFSDWWIYQFN
jgi:hypothetical protein